MATAFMQTCQRSKIKESYLAGGSVRVLAIVLVCISMSNAARGQGQPYGQYPTISTSSIPAPPSIPTPQTEMGNGLVAVNEAGESASGSWFDLPLLKRIAAGGWLMIPLAVCSLIVFSLTIERLIALRRSRVIPRPFVRRFTECVEDGQLSYEEASEICEEFDCPVAEVFQAAVKRWGRPMLEIEQAVMDAGDRVADGLKRFLRVFHAISNVAPLIGLLGTVLGMIDSFESMSSITESGNSEMLAAGISTALITTAGDCASRSQHICLTCISVQRAISISTRSTVCVSE